MTLRHPPRAALALTALAAFLGCGSDRVTDPSPDDCGTPRVLGELQGVTVGVGRGERQCVTLTAEGARYLVVPQLATPDDPRRGLNEEPPSIAFALSSGVGGGGPVLDVARGQPAGRLRAVQPRPNGRQRTSQQRLDARLRQREHGYANVARQRATPSGPRPNLSVAAPPPVVGQITTFQVLNTLDEKEAFTPVTATAKFVGENVAVYLDNAAPPALDDATLTAYARTFDDKLYPAVVSNFGAESDIDANGVIIVLLTPVVNKLVTADECMTNGFVTGFFYGRDLVPSLANSNKAEIFYGMVPDPTGSTGSCAHRLEDFGDLVPSTFVHEFQHMISYNQHVLVRGGADEEPWLNEGLSHMAEEVASLLYERDPSQPRTNPEQIFPDSAQGFINGNFGNAYDYLVDPTAHSVTNFTGFGTLPERGAAWLFLRWLGDQRGDGIFKRLVETNNTGIANVQAQAGAPFAQLHANFATAVYAANLPADVRAGLPGQYQFTSRDLKVIYARLNTVAPAIYSRVYPVVAKALAAGGSAAGTMFPGTQDWYVLNTNAGDALTTVRFAGADGQSLRTELVPQVTVFRLPNATP
ncbi:MAG TPA: hypothetical protein VHQ45_16470 [Gemmatimonadaceae bacterium]|nr:hypothetical protein [Gemmatimonadaceae bacterium]